MSSKRPANNSTIKVATRKQKYKELIEIGSRVGEFLENFP